MSVLAATQAFGSELRVHLIHYFARTPGRQIDAAQALGADRAVVSLNTRALVEIGVLVSSPGTDARTRVFHVDLDRMHELLSALEDFGSPGGSSPDL